MIAAVTPVTESMINQRWGSVNEIKEGKSGVRNTTELSEPVFNVLAVEMRL